MAQSSLLKSSGIFGVMTLVSRILGFVRDQLQASVYGAGTAADAYLVAYKIPNFLRRLFAEGAFAQAFVPMLTATREQEPEQLQDFVDSVAGTLAGVTAVVSLLGVVLAPWILLVYAPGFSTDPAKATLGASLLRIVFPFIFFVSLTSFTTSILNAAGKFAVGALTPVILNICLIVALLFFAGDIRAQAWAVLAGGLIQLLFQLPFVAQLGLLPKPRWAWADPKVRKLIRLMVPIVIGSSVAQISLLLDTVLASLLANGSVSWLFYADRLMEFPLGLFSIAIGTVVLPALSRNKAQADVAGFSHTLDWGLKAILVIGVPCALGLLLLADHLSALIFQRGRFTAHDTAMTGFALMAYAFGFLGFSLVKVLLPAFYSRHDSRTPMRFGMIALASGMAFNTVIVLLAKNLGWAAAHAGLAVGTSINAWVNAGLLYRRLRAEGAYVPSADAGWGKFGARLAVACALMVAFLGFAAGPPEGWVASGGHLAAVARAAGVIVGAAVLYFGGLYATGWRVSELRR